MIWLQLFAVVGTVLVSVPTLSTRGRHSKCNRWVR